MAERDIIARLVVEGQQQFVQQVGTAAKAEEDLNKSLRENARASETSAKAQGQLNTATQQTTKSQAQLRTQLRDAREELAQLALAGKANTKEYKALRDEAGRLDDALGKVSAEIRQAGSDTRGLDKALRATTVLTGAFTAAQGAAALFGKDSEDLQRSLLKVQAALSVLNGLQAAQTELLRKDSIFTGAATKAKQAYTVALGTSTGALRAFRLALIATGIGAIVVLIGTLIANWDRLTAAVRRSFPAIDGFGDAFNRVRENVVAFFSAYFELIKTFVNVLKGVGDVVTAAFTPRKSAIKAAREVLDTIRNGAQNIGKAFDESKKKQQELTKEKKEQQKVEKEIERLQIEIAKKEAQRGDATQLRIQLLRNEQKLLTEGTVEYFEKQKEINDLLDAEVARRKDINKELRENLSTLGGIQGRINEISQQLQTLDPNSEGLLIKALFGERQQLQQRQEEVERALDSLFFQARGIERESITFLDPIETQALADETLAINESLVGDLIALRKRQQEAFSKIREEEIEAERQLQQQRVEEAQTIQQGALQVFSQLQAAQQQILDNRLRQGLISEEQYEEEIRKLRRRQAIADKVSAIFNAALAVKEAFARELVRTGPIGAAIAKGLALANLAAVIATPIPKFKTGKKGFEGGLAILGDGGKREPITDAKGELIGISPAKDTLYNLPKGANIFKDMPTYLKSLNEQDRLDVQMPLISPAMSKYKPKQQPIYSPKELREIRDELQYIGGYIKQGNRFAMQTAKNTKTMKYKPKKVYV